jgi:hypothetical protein
MRDLIEARLKRSKRMTYKYAKNFTVLCTNRSSSATRDCGYPLGRIWRFTAEKDADLTDPENWEGGPGGFTDYTSIAAHAMAHYADLSRADRQETLDGKHLQVWLAEHEIGYCQLPNRDYQVLRRRDPFTEPERVVRTPLFPWSSTMVERHRSRRPLTEEDQEFLYEKANVAEGTVHGLPPDGRAVKGVFPALPAVIVCPQCSPAPRRSSDRCRQATPGATRNLVLPLAFDEQRGTWYAVRTD